MCKKLVSKVFDLKLGATPQKLVALRLAAGADKAGRGRINSLPELARELELVEPAVRRIVLGFHAQGLIRLRTTPGMRGFKYRFDLDELKARRQEATH